MSMQRENKHKRTREAMLAHKGAVLTARFTRDGNKFLTGGEDNKIRLWDFHTAKLSNTFKDHASQVNDLDLTSDNLHFCSCDRDGKILYWDLSQGRVIKEIQGHGSEVNAVRLNEFESVVVSAGSDRLVRIWDCRSHSTRPIQIFDSFEGNVMSISLTRTQVIAGSVDGTVRKFDLRNARELIYRLGQPVTRVSSVSYGSCVIASCLDSTLRLLDVHPTRSNTGDIEGEYKGHTCKTSKIDCCIINNGDHVVGGSKDGNVFIWDVLTGSVLSKFRAHSSVVTSIAYHPNDNSMVTASVTGSVRVWKESTSS